MRALLHSSLLALAAWPQDLPTAAGEHVDVVCWFASVRHGSLLAGQALDAGERAWRAGRDFFGAEGPGERIVVNVYEERRGESGFADAVKSIDPGVPVAGAAWHHHPSRGVFVRLQPAASDPLQAELEFPVLSLRKLATEVALLARGDAAGGEDPHPTWLARAAARAIADRIVVDMGRAPAGGECPEISTRLRRARALRAAGSAPELGAWLEGEASEPDPAVEPEALEDLGTLLFAFLGGELGPERVAELLRPALAGAEPAGAALAERLAGALSLAGAAELEERFWRWIDAQPAPWDEEFPSLSRHKGGGWVLAAAESPYALAWLDPPPWKDYVVRAEVRLFRDPKGIGHVAFALGRAESGDYVSLSFSTRENVAWEYSREQNHFEALTPKALGTGLLPERWYRISLRVHDGRITGFVRDLEEPEEAANMMRPLAVEGRDMSGPWGVLSKKNSGAQLKNLVVEEYRPKDGEDPERAGKAPGSGDD